MGFSCHVLDCCNWPTIPWTAVLLSYASHPVCHPGLPVHLTEVVHILKLASIICIANFRLFHSIRVSKLYFLNFAGNDGPLHLFEDEVSYLKKQPCLEFSGFVQQDDFTGEISVSMIRTFCYTGPPHTVRFTHTNHSVLQCKWYSDPTQKSLGHVPAKGSQTGPWISHLGIIKENQLSWILYLSQTVQPEAWEWRQVFYLP